MKRFLSDEVKEAFTASIKDVESRSSAEIVVAVRARSATYRHVELVVGVIATFAALAYMLYAEHEFSIPSLLVDPFIAGLVAGLITTQIDPLRRLLTPPRMRSESVRIAAQATFYANGVRMTSERTGILIYLSLLERIVEVIPDSGVLEALDDDEWETACEAVSAALVDVASGPAVADAIARLGDILEPALPRSQFDVNELADEVDA